MTRTDFILLGTCFFLVIGNITQIVLLRSRRLIGPRGARGIVGPAGPAGPAGPRGMDGRPGQDFNVAPDGTAPRFVP